MGPDQDPRDAKRVTGASNRFFNLGRCGPATPYELRLYRPTAEPATVCARHPNSTLKLPRPCPTRSKAVHRDAFSPTLALRTATRPL
eukprot:4085485-Prymnesium_polylepis.2